MSLAIGDVLDGKYRVVRRIGEGGMGTVFEGEHTKIRRRVAIKVLSPKHASDENVKRFAHEAQAAGTIRNDHILEVLDIGEANESLRYLVMEYLDGETLKERISTRKQLGCEELMILVQQVLIGLAAAHNAGVIHRDLKPDNIFILREKAGRQDFVKIIDFGVSKFVSMDKDAMRVTRAGSLLGTPVYMSPEQARGLNDADHRSDIYTLGVIMYEAISGKLPFDGNSFHDLLFKIALSPAEPLARHAPDVDPGVAAIVMKAMAKQPAQRYQTAAELAADVDKWLSQRTLVHGSALGSAPSWTKSGNRGLSDSGAKAPSSSSRLPDADRSAPSIGTTDSISSPPEELVRARPRMGIYAAIAAVLVLGSVGTTIAVTRSSTPIANARTVAPSPPPVTPRLDPPPPEPIEATPPASAATSAAPATTAKPAAKPATAKPAAAKPPAHKPPNGAPDFGY